MKSDLLWQLFAKTGSPVAYIMFAETRRMETSNVSEHERPGSTGHAL